MGSLSLNIGLNALLTAQSALDTIGHNIANANTPGYSRQNLQLQPGRTLQLRGLHVGSGVDATHVARTVDDFVNRRLFGQTSTLKQLEARLSALSDTETLLREPGANGVSAVLQDMFAKFAELSSAPADPIGRSATVASVDALAAGLRGVGNDLAELDTELEARTRAAVDRVNGLTRDLSELNRQIVAAEVTGQPANTQRDARDLLIRQLSEEIEVSVSETPRGALHVFADGQMLVGGGSAAPLRLERSDSGALELILAGGTHPIDPRSGAIDGLLSFIESTLPDLRGDLDRFAGSLVLEANRRHSTGTPPSGGFRRLTGDFALVDGDGDGTVLDERLGSLEGPFDAQDGELFVHVLHESTGAISTHRVAVDAKNMTVGGFLQQISDLPGLSAQVDTTGRVQIQAASGFTFDFSRRLDAAGNSQGTLGGSAATLGSLSGAPFALGHGDTLTLDTGSGPFAVTFQAADFDDIGAATAEEVAAVINADGNVAANGLRALASGGQVFLQTLAEGSGVSFDVVGGAAAGALGWGAGTTVTGQERAVDVQLGGSYLGDTNRSLTFRATADGEIGTTPGLQIEVRDGQGTQVALLDVGAGYQPGTELALPDGLSVKFSAGDVSATDGDGFTRHFLVDSDTSDVLVALGLNGLFSGATAASIAVTDRVLADPGLLATSSNGDNGDNGVLLGLAELQHLAVEGLEQSVGDFYSGLVGGLGLATQSTTRALEIEGQLVQSLEARRDQASGVSLDEELVNLIQFEQAFGAASRFIQVANSLQDEVLNIL